jgi:hypothetical protein
MGDIAKEPKLIDTDARDTNRVSIIAIMMAALTFFAPVAVSGVGFFYLVISAVLWSIYLNGYNIRFEFHNSFTLIIMIPFAMFRVASTYLIVRYYQRKTTKGRAIIAAVLGDAPFLFIYSFLFIMMSIYGGLGLNFPVPIMMIVGFLLLWRFPVEEVTVPWESPEEPTPWWGKKPPDTKESPDDNQSW